jgi:predicted PurR-regulated permease PerM
MHDIKKVIIAFIVLLSGQIVDGGFITPKIVGSRLGVHPLWVIFGVLISVPLFGIFGILLALPMVGIFNVLIKYMFEKYRHSDVYKN